MWRLRLLLRAAGGSSGAGIGGMANALGGSPLTSGFWPGLVSGASIAPLIPFSVAIVARWTSSVWMVVRSMLEFSSSHASTARRSAIRLSSSFTSSVGATMLGSCCGRRIAIDARLPALGIPGRPAMPHIFFIRSKLSPIVLANGRPAAGPLFFMVVSSLPAVC